MSESVSVPHWLYGEDTEQLQTVSPSLAHGERGWYFWDHVGVAAHGPYRTASEALEAAHQWRTL